MQTILPLAFSKEKIAQDSIARESDFDSKLYTSSVRADYSSTLE